MLACLRLSELSVSPRCGLLILVVWGTLSVTPAPGAEPGAAEVTVVADVTYAAHKEGEGKQQELQLDLAYPTQGTNKHPAVLLFHGGGWTPARESPTPRQSSAWRSTALSLRPSVIDWLQHVPSRRPFTIPKAAVRWLRANAAKYAIDPEAVAVVGYSAGGDLALMLGVTNGLQEWEGDGGHRDQSSTVQAVVAYYPLTDLTALHGQCQRKEYALSGTDGVSLALGGYLGVGRPDVCAKVHLRKPLSHVSKKSAPTFLIHGTADQQVPVQQSEIFAGKLRQVEAPVSLLKLEKAGHQILRATLWSRPRSKHCAPEKGVATAALMASQSREARFPASEFQPGPTFLPGETSVRAEIVTLFAETLCSATREEL